MLQIMPNKRLNYEFAAVLFGTLVFWIFLALAVYAGVHARRQHDMQYVSSCPRLPSQHQQHRPIIT